jgi:hypothetical protein
MVYIRTRKNADGTPRSTAIVRIRNGKLTVHQEARTFTQKGAAEKWAKAREVTLEDPSSVTGPDRASGLSLLSSTS